MERRAIRSDHISHMTCTVHILTPRSKSRRRRDEKILVCRPAVQEPRFYQDGAGESMTMCGVHADARARVAVRAVREGRRREHGEAL